MKWLFILFLVINLCYLGWELDKQTKIQVSNSVRPFTVPKDAQKLVLLEEMDSIPELEFSPNLTTLPDESTEIIGSEESNEFDITEFGNDNFDIESLDESGVTESINDEDTIQGIATLMEQGDVMISQQILRDTDLRLSYLNQDVSQNNNFGAGAKTDSGSAAMCFSFGPFAEETQAKELNDWFEENNVESVQRDEGDGDALFWIYLSPRESEEEALSAIEDLKGSGVQDYKLISKGTLQNAISLGLFSSQAAVNKRLNELKSFGYLPIMVPYHKSKSILWIDTKVKGQGSVLSDLFSGYPSRFNSIPVRCEDRFQS